MITIDNLAHRYGLLPSEALARGSSYDLKVMAISNTYHNKMREEQQNKGLKGNKPVVPEAPVLSKEEMIKMIKKVREK